MGKKVRKFKPCKQYRYLVGTAAESHCIADLKEFNKHRYKVRYAVGETS